MFLYVTVSWSILFFSMFIPKPYLYHIGIGTVSLQGTFLAITLGVINKQPLMYYLKALHGKNEGIPVNTDTYQFSLYVLFFVMN
ncbi:hypothetical protein EG68_04289 [Paragonimus skrjabini miyazakii]|uniref:Uncharacterized protein n=1 Tax=Paragonimus skrjabini miyazakii TaxID=59628 RepID=A0A8S9YY56_9TREM|nr:hypothetical protein EG68_04289 [Paragonimus skrjabini miyazakii]